MSDSLAARVWQRAKAGTGGGGAPTFTAPESKNKSDVMTLAPRLTDAKNKSDRLALSPLLTDAKNKSDAYRLPTVSFAAPESKNKSDLSKFTVTETARARSGTPDTDRWGDAWTDATIGQTGINHGTASPLQVTGGTAATEQRAYIEADLTGYTGLTATGSAHTFTVFTINGNAVAQTITVNFGASASRPFTESTIVQTNQPATPSLFTKTLTFAGSTSASQSVTLADSEMQQLLGKWALVVLTGATAGLLVTVHSREGATPPQFTFTATR